MVHQAARKRMEEEILGAPEHRGECDFFDRIANPEPNIEERLIAPEEHQEKRQVTAADVARGFAMILEKNLLYA
jgi:hypothetical protein